MKMKQSYLMITLMLAGLIFASSAQSYNVLIRPEEAIVEPGAGMKFEAQVFSEDGTIVASNQKFEWKVIPPELGTITEDGFFIASKKPGKGEIIAATTINGQPYAGTAHVTVGTPPEPEIEIVIRPKEALVEPGDTLRFVALAKGRGGIALQWNSVRWIVEPNFVGHINHHGLFTAGERLGQGKVMALVEIEHQIYRGIAKLVVSPKPTSAIAGVVTNDLGQALEDAKVSVHRIGNIHWHRRAITNENGEYLLEKLIPGYYVVRAEAKDYVPEYYDDVRYLSEATPVEVADADTVDGIDFALSEGASITGLVTANEDGQPIAGAHIKAFLLVNPDRKFHTLAEEDGTYKLGALTTGSYVVHANQAGYKGEYFDDVQELQDATLVRAVEPNETADINFGLATASAISGVVTNETDGSPIADAVVSVRTLLSEIPPSPRPNQFLHTVRTGEDGSYTIQAKPGFYLVHAIAKGFAHEWYDDAETPQTATPVQVFEDQHTTGIDLDLWPLGAITGTVVDQETGEPLIGAHVKAFKEGPGYEPRPVLTDSLGNYTIENLPAGDFVVRANAKDYLPEFWEEAENVEDATIITVENATTVEGIDFTLALGGTVTGVVLSEDDDAPIAGAIIKVVSTDSRMKYYGRSAEDGTYQVTGIRTGTYIAKAKVKGYQGEWYENAAHRSEATEFEVTAGETTEEINFSLAKIQAHSGAISGLVTDDNTGMPIDAAPVLAMQMGTGRLFRGISGPEGDYKIEALRPGLYIVFSWAEGYLGEFYNDAHRWWQADPVLVKMNQETTGIDFALTPREEGAYMISGSISTRSGDPLEGVLVFAENESGIIASDVSEEDGSYALSNLPAGSYKVRASAVGYQDSYYGGSSEEAASALSVGMGMNVNDANLTSGVESTKVGDIEQAIPSKFSLAQNFPNPFNPSTEIRFALPADADVTLKVYNLLGEEVATLVNEQRDAGQHTAIWNGTDSNGRPLTSGMYIYRLEARASDGSHFVQTRRMIFLK